jgi:TPR repeat protein
MLQKLVPLFIFVAIGVVLVMFRHSLAEMIGIERPAENADGAEAVYRQGIAYAYGKGVIVDYAKAIDYFRAAAKADYAPAERELGMLYVEGKGVAPDPQQGLQWIVLAAEQGEMGAVLAIPMLTLRGQTDIEVPELVKWMEVCALHDPNSEERSRCAAVFDKFEKSFNTSPAANKVFADGKRLAQEWQPRAQGSKHPIP